MRVTLDVPDRVWWAAAAGAEGRGTNMPAVLNATIPAEAMDGRTRVVRDRMRREMVAQLAREGHPDAVICERLGETRQYAAAAPGRGHPGEPSAEGGRMSERCCIRGCTIRGQHFASCPWFGMTDTAAVAVAQLPNTPPLCTGCVPVEARDGMLVCDRCFRRIRHHLDDAADLLAHLRSLADPIKAAVYDKVMVSSSRKKMPAPLPADLIDASTM